jgi:hypothetical protein
VRPSNATVSGAIGTTRISSREALRASASSSASTIGMCRTNWFSM